jgi:hypothetical protein
LDAGGGLKVVQDRLGELAIERSVYNNFLLDARPTARGSQKQTEQNTGDENSAEQQRDIPDNRTGSQTWTDQLE